MPLRFDQPELLGKWEGDSAPLHQAIAKIGKGESVLERGLEKKNPKTPSYKIDPVKGSPFKKDNDKIGKLVAQAAEAVGRGEDPIQYTTKYEQIANTGFAQKNALDQIKLQVNELQQTYGSAIDPTPVSKEINLAYNDHDDETRGTAIESASKYIADPSEKMFNSEKHTSNIFLARPEQSLVYTNKDESGNVNIGNERKVTGRLLVPDTKRPQYEYKNNKKVPLVDANGQPVYEMRNATTIDDALPEAKALFDNDRNYADWTTKQVAKIDKGTIDELTAEWVSSERNRPDGGVPSKEIIEAKKQLIARDLAERKVAKQLLQLDRGATISSPTRTLDEPKASDKNPRIGLGAYGSNSEQEVTVHVDTEANERGMYTDIMGSDGKTIKKQLITTKSPIFFQIHDLSNSRDKELAGKETVIPPSTKAYDHTTGQVIENIDQLGKYAGTTIEVFGTKNGKERMLQTNTSDYASFIKGKKEQGYSDIKVVPMNSFLVFDKKNPYKDPQDAAEYEKMMILRQKPAGRRDNKELGRLEAKFANDMREVSTPAEATMSQISKYDKDPVSILYKSKDKKAIQRYEQMVKAASETGIKKQAVAKKTTSEVERKTSDGKIAIFDSNTKQFLRYK